MKQTLLIVEDELDILDMIQLRLKKEKFHTLTANNGRDAITTIQEKRPDLVILDLMLPFVNGLDVLRFSRKSYPEIPVLILSAKGEETDIVVGLELGADDYVVKPFSMSILIARIKALLRRSLESTTLTSATIIAGPLRIDNERFKASLDNIEMPKLTRTEFRLLSALAAAKGRVLTRTQLIEEAIGADTLVTDRTIDVHLTSLRNKMGSYRDLLETVRGIGYRFRENKE